MELHARQNSFMCIFACTNRVIGFVGTSHAHKNHNALFQNKTMNVNFKGYELSKVYFYFNLWFFFKLHGTNIKQSPPHLHYVSIDAMQTTHELIFNLK